MELIRAKKKRNEKKKVSYVSFSCLVFREKWGYQKKSGEKWIMRIDTNFLIFISCLAAFSPCCCCFPSTNRFLSQK